MTGTDRLKPLLQEGDTAAVINFLESNPEVLRERDSSGATGLLLVAYHRGDALMYAMKLVPDLNFYEAIVCGQIAQVERDINKYPELIDAYSPDGFTPIALACFFQRHEIASMLLNKGADPNKNADNVSRVNALHAAVAKNDVELCKLLLEKGADVNAVQTENVTALHSAAHRGNLEMVVLLVAHGANVSAAMKNGDTALAIAIRENKQSVKNYLESLDKDTPSNRLSDLSS